MNILISLLLVLASGLCHAQEPLKVLFLTDYSDVFHANKEQAKLFAEGFEKRVNSDVVVVGRDTKELTESILKDDFADAYDLVVLQACIKNSSQSRVEENFIKKTIQAKKPIMLIHCALHSFKPNFAQGLLMGSALLGKNVVWSDGINPFSLTPWWKLTGFASSSHTPIVGIDVDVDRDHPITQNIPYSWTPVADERYKEIARSEKTIPLLTDEKNQLVAWLHEVNDVEIFATTLGHRKKAYKDPVFLDLLSRAALHITGHLDANGDIEAGFAGNEKFENYSGTFTCSPSSIITLNSQEKVAATIKKYSDLKMKMKVVSIDNPNSYSDVICSKQGGVVLNLAPMNKLLSVDKKNKRVVVEPGITIHDLGKQLEKHDLVFQTTADFSGITVAGGLGTGAHHSSLKIGSGIHDYVTRLKLVNAEGNFVELVGEKAQNAAIHLGYLGAIVEVELKVDDMHKLRYGYISGDDDGVESIIEDEVRKHEYARVSWFVGAGRFVLDYYDRVSMDVDGDSYHNLWESSVGPSSILGSLPYDAVNRLPQAVQCTASNLRSRAWAAPIKALNSPAKNPVGLAHKMLGSSCEKGSCPWDFGLLSRTQELAIPVSKMKAWMQDVRRIIAKRKACFPVLGIYLRFAKKSESFLSPSFDEDMMMFEIHVPKETDKDRFEQGTAVYDEIQQMTLYKYNGKPHWAKNSAPIFSGALKSYSSSSDFISLKNEIDPQQLFENDFWTNISQGYEKDNYPGCALKRECICVVDSDCGPGFSCVAGGFYKKARVCLENKSRF